MKGKNYRKAPRQSWETLSYGCFVCRNSVEAVCSTYDNVIINVINMESTISNGRLDVVCGYRNPKIPR